MKKLLIVSLFLLSMIGLMAQGSPHFAIFYLETEAGEIHTEGSFGYKAVLVSPPSAGGGEQWYSPNFIYWNYPGQDDLNTGGTSYNTETGGIGIQMAALAGWGAEWGPGNIVTANFYFIDGDGNEVGPYNLTKSDADETIYPDVIAWGGPTGPVVPDAWATYLNPANGATNVGINMDNVDVTMPALNWSYTGTVDPDGFEVWINGEHIDDVDFEVGSAVYGFMHPVDLAYATDYEWGIKPYINTEAKKGMKASREMLYPPEGDMPENWTFTTMDEPVVIVGPDAWATAVTPMGEDVALDAQLTWNYEGTVVPTGYMLEWNGGEAMDLGNVMTYNPGALNYNTEYTWSVIPYVNNAAKRGMKATRELLPPAGEKPVWSFTTMAEYVAPEEEVGGTDINLTIVFPGPTPAGFLLNQPTQIFVPGFVLPPLTAFNFGVTINQGVAGQFTYTFSTSLLAGRVFVDGVPYYAGNFPGGIVTVVLDFTGAKDVHEVVITEPTLPVELSAFTAVAHADEYVTLNWVTESESNLQGYNVYRAETESFEQAMRINPTTVIANNSTQTSNYSYTDNEVETATYYYWLEVAELSNENTFHGPIVVKVEEDNVVPGITETTFRNFGPSPFTSSTSTSLRVKEGETASVTIYNLLGQVVSRESFNAGEHNYTFNGRDLNNKTVANGIYFVRMTSPTESKSFKIVKIK